MEYTKLGNSELNVSRICLGCMGFGNANEGSHKWAIDETSSYNIIKRALELGVNFFDTAIGYQNGTSEQHTGKALKSLANRSDIVIATKFLPRSAEEIADGITGKQHINNSLDASLKNLGMDYIDLYICHMWDYHTSIEEIMEALNEAVKSGKVRAIGISNCYAWQLAKANNIAEKNGWAKFVSVQGHYNLIFREEEREMKPFCEDSGIALTPYSPLASGRLVKDTDELSKRIELDDMQKSKYDATSEQDRVIIQRVQELAEKKGLTRTQIALGWLLTKVTSPIVGATKISHIEEAVKAVGITLTEQETAYLEECYIPHKLVGVMEFNHA
ncbi:MAG: aldo/keto reductase [Clostridium sp.]|nr:aldo/keto reductase [Clostridium sp.]